MTLSILYMGFFSAAIFCQWPTRAAIHSATSTIEAVIADWFPEDIVFNESCVAEGFPTLPDIICPRELEINSLRRVTKMVSNCMKGPICGIIIDPRPIKSLVTSMEEFLPGVEIDGNVTIVPGSGYLTNISNISNIQLEISANENQLLPLQATMLIPDLRAYGRAQIDFRLVTVFAPTLTASLTQTTFDIGIQFTSTISINKSINGDRFDIRFVDPTVRARPLLCGTDMPTGFPNIHSLLTATSQLVLENSSIAKAIGNFMRRLYQSVIQVVSNKCKQQN